MGIGVVLAVFRSAFLQDLRGPRFERELTVFESRAYVEEGSRGGPTDGVGGGGEEGERRIGEATGRPSDIASHVFPYSGKIRVAVGGAGRGGVQLRFAVSSPGNSGRRVIRPLCRESQR